MWIRIRNTDFNPDPDVLRELERDRSQKTIDRFKAVIQVAMGQFLTGKKTTGLGSNSLRHRHQKPWVTGAFNTEKTVSLT